MLISKLIPLIKIKDEIKAILLNPFHRLTIMGPEASVYVYNNGQENYAINFAQLTQKDESFLLGREKNR